MKEMVYKKGYVLNFEADKKATFQKVDKWLLFFLGFFFQKTSDTLLL